MHAQMLPPATEEALDDREELVRYDLADTALCFELRCVAATIANAQTRSAWEMVSADFSSALVLRGDTSTRRLLSASADASEELAAGRLEAAIARLAKNRHVDVETWLSDVRGERAAKGGAR